MWWVLGAVAEARELDFDAAVRAALEQGPAARIVAAEADRERAEARAEVAWENPAVELGQRPDETEVVVSVPIDVGAFGRGAVARAEREAAAVRGEAGLAAVAAAAGATYLDAVRAREHAALADEAAALARRLSEGVLLRAAAGELSLSEAALLRAEAARALDAALTLRRDAELAARRLGALLAEEPPTVAGWPRLAEPPAVAVADVPEVVAAGVKARASLARLGAERLGLIPDLSLSAGYVTGGHVGPVYGAAIEIPLFAPGAARVKAAKAASIAASGEAERAAREAEVTLVEARAELRIAEEVASAWDIPGLTTALDAAARRYEAGESSLAAFVAERDLALAALGGAIDARWRVERARLALWELAGKVPTEVR